MIICRSQFKRIASVIVQNRVFANNSGITEPIMTKFYLVMVLKWNTCLKTLGPLGHGPENTNFCQEDNASEMTFLSGLFE